MTHVSRSVFRSRPVRGAACLSFLVAATLVGCGDENLGTDIEVPAGGTASGGTSANAGTDNRAGTSSQAGSTNEGGEGGMTDGGESGSSGSSNGGNAGNGGMAGSGTSGGGAGGMSGGSAGGMSGGGAGGLAGTSGGGAGGIAGTAGGGAGGMAGTAGTAGGSGMAGGGTGGVNSCGNGTKETAEECDGSVVGTPWKGDRLCSIDCETVSTQACVDCEQAGDCFASSDNCMGPAGTPFTDEQIRTCYDVVDCIRDSKCLDGAGSLGKCYCGTLSTAACGAAPYNLSSPGAPNGPCALIMQKGNPGVTTNSGILGGLTTKSRPAGAAGQRLNCQKNDPACNEPCGVLPIP